MQTKARLLAKEATGEMQLSLAVRLSQIRSSIVAWTRLRKDSGDERVAVECSDSHAT